MKKRRVKYIILIWCLLLFSLINSINVVANGTPDYIGFNKNDEFIWKFDFDEDVGQSRSMGLEVVHNRSLFNLDDDVDALRIVPTWIDEEEKHSGDKGVDFKMNYYETETHDPEDWDLEDEGQKNIIFKWNKYDASVIKFYKSCAMWGAYFVAKDVDWKLVMEKLADDLGLGNGDAYYKNGKMYIEIYDNVYMDFYNNTYEMQDINIVCKYNSDGVLEYYKLEQYDYGDDLDIEISLENAFWHEYWLWVVIGILGLIGILIIGLVIIVRMKKKPKVVPKGPVDAPSPVIPAISEPVKVEAITYFCPYCGIELDVKAKFCVNCGGKID